ncbi:MAG TPA: nucleoside monophosphate kinase [bacterium]|jgi:adenylate kinase|nr:nucleoside monophosphate kinase [bacterium]
MKLLLIGPQGCGKGTIGKKLSQHLNIPLVSVGQILRDLPDDYPGKDEIENYVDKGELAPQNLVSEILKSEISKDIYGNGFIFDGWGRTLEDLDYFNPGFDKVIFINISPETSIKRISSRRTCENCGAVFNVVSVPPKVDGICDFCGGKLVQREDDVEEAVKTRLAIFNKETTKVIDYFRKQGNLVEVNGEGSPDEVFQLVLKGLE